MVTLWTLFIMSFHFWGSKEQHDINDHTKIRKAINISKISIALRQASTSVMSQLEMGHFGRVAAILARIHTNNLGPQNYFIRCSGKSVFARTGYQRILCLWSAFRTVALTMTLPCGWKLIKVLHRLVQSLAHIQRNAGSGTKSSNLWTWQSKFSAEPCHCADCVVQTWNTTTHSHHDMINPHVRMPNVHNAGDIALVTFLLEFQHCAPCFSVM